MQVYRRVRTAIISGGVFRNCAINDLDPGEVDFDWTSDTTEPDGCWDEGVV